MLTYKLLNLYDKIRLSTSRSCPRDITLDPACQSIILLFASAACRLDIVLFLKSTSSVLPILSSAEFIDLENTASTTRKSSDGSDPAAATLSDNRRWYIHRHGKT